jgi:methyltransferase (TIGR00027 family)
MEQNQLSLTAIMTAYMRAYHANYDTPKVVDDFLAYRLLPEERRAIIEQGLLKALQFNDIDLTTLHPDQMAAVAGKLQSMGASNVLSRSSYTEKNLEIAVLQGIKQYVILGAGMDTFAFRCPELVEQLQVFEVDHPAMQAFKRHRLDELGWEKPLQLHFVPVDFTRDNLAAALTQSMFDPQAKSFFSWLGVTMYLTRDEAFETLSAITQIASAGSIVIFDYLNTEVPSQAASLVRTSLAQQVKEPIKSGFDPSTLAADIAPLGLRLHENLSQTDIENRYFLGRTDGYHATKHGHLAYAIVK